MNLQTQNTESETYLLFAIYVLFPLMQYIGIKNLDIRNYGVSDGPGVNRQDWDQGENGDIHITRS